VTDIAIETSQAVELKNLSSTKGLY